MSEKASWCNPVIDKTSCIGSKCMFKDCNKCQFSYLKIDKFKEKKMRREDFIEIKEEHFEICEKFIKNGGDCDVVDCRLCPFRKDNAVNGERCFENFGYTRVDVVRSAEQFLEFRKNKTNKKESKMSKRDMMRGIMARLQKEYGIKVCDARKLSSIDECYKSFDKLVEAVAENKKAVEMSSIVEQSRDVDKEINAIVKKVDELKVEKIKLTGVIEKLEDENCKVKKEKQKFKTKVEELEKSNKILKEQNELLTKDIEKLVDKKIDLVGAKVMKQLKIDDLETLVAIQKRKIKRMVWSFYGLAILCGIAIYFL